MKSKEFIKAPIFNHGEGFGCTGSFYGFAHVSKEDALHIINEVFSAQGYPLQKYEVIPEPILRYQAMIDPKGFMATLNLNHEQLGAFTNKVYDDFHELNNTYFKKKLNSSWYKRTNKLQLLKRFLPLPLFVDFYNPELNLIIKYISKEDCQIYDENHFDGDSSIEYFYCKDTAVKFRKYLSRVKGTNCVVFYDPVHRYLLEDENSHDELQKAILNLKLQISDFFKWIGNKNAESIQH